MYNDNRKIKSYSTRDEAIQHEIIPALGDYADDYNIDAIADAVVNYFTDDDIQNFWSFMSSRFEDTELLSSVIEEGSDTYYPIEPGYAVPNVSEAVFWYIVAEHEKETDE